MTVSRAYTRTGDKGDTGLFGGPRVSKDSPRIEAYGCVDELNSYIGLARSFADEKDIDQILRRVQDDLFALGADLATPLKAKVAKKIPRITREDTNRLEAMTDRFDKELQPLKTFILPTGSRFATHLQVARALCRRAERRVVTLSKKETINGEILPYVNRLSSLLFVLARVVNRRSGNIEIPWSVK